MSDRACVTRKLAMDLGEKCTELQRVHCHAISNYER
jgi:hypothetical protein